MRRCFPLSAQAFVALPESSTRVEFEIDLEDLDRKLVSGKTVNYMTPPILAPYVAVDHFNSALASSKPISEEIIVLPSTQLTLQAEIGSGAFASVFFGNLSADIFRSDKTTREEFGVAIKIFNQDKTNLEVFLREARALNMFSHQNIVSLIGISKINNKFALIMEYCYGGSLFFQLHPRADRSSRENKTSDFSDKFLSCVKKIALGVIIAIQYMHKAGIVHCDICAANVMLTHDFTPKLGDFGQARPPGLCCPGFGHAEYRAPEISLTAKKFSKAVLFEYSIDVFAFGVLLWELHHPGEVPWDGTDFEARIYAGGTPALDFDNDELETLCGLCLSRQPALRPNASSVLSTLQYAYDVKEITTK